MPLRAQDLIELAEAGQKAIGLARQQGQETLRLCALARQGQIKPTDLLVALEEIFLGQDLLWMPLEQPFDRTLSHYSKLRLRVNANAARRMALTRRRQRIRRTEPEFDLGATAEPDNADNADNEEFFEGQDK
jgi:hypothetical protein